MGPEIHLTARVSNIVHTFGGHLWLSQVGTGAPELEADWFGFSQLVVVKVVSQSSIVLDRLAIVYLYVRSLSGK